MADDDGVDAMVLPTDAAPVAEHDALGHAESESRRQRGRRGQACDHLHFQRRVLLGVVQMSIKRARQKRELRLCRRGEMGTPAVARQEGPRRTKYFRRFARCRWPARHDEAQPPERLREGVGDTVRV